MASINGYARARIWDSSTGEQLRSLLLPYGLHCIAYNPGGDKFAVGGIRYDKLLQIRDATTGEVVRELPKGTGTRSLTWTPDGKRVIAALESPHIIKTWDAESGREIYSIKMKSSSRFSLSPNGKLIATTTDLTNSSCRVELWDAQTGKHFSSLTHGKVCQHIRQEKAVWSPDSSQLA